jgi:cell division protein FtsB
MELAGLHAEIASLENLTRRMSDDYLDIDLLDQQSRDILGQIRADEIIIR